MRACAQNLGVSVLRGRLTGTLHLLTAVGAVVALTACGGGASNVESKGKATHTNTLPAPATETANQTGDPGAGEAEPLPSETETTEPTEAEAGLTTGAPRNDRGNIVKKLGEEGGFLDFEGNELLTFTVDSIEPANCTEDLFEQPEGTLYALDLRVSTSPKFTTAMDGAYSYFVMSGYDWTFVDSEGVVHDSLDSLATYGCLADGAKFTSDALAPGSKYRGTLLLDLPREKGRLVYRPSGLEGGWEWPVS